MEGRKQQARWVRFATNWLLHRLSNRQFLIFGAIVVGLWAGLTAVLMKTGVHFLQHTITDASQEAPAILWISPALGILLTLLFVRLFFQGYLQKGTAYVLLAIARKSSVLPARDTIAHAITSTLTIGFGGSAGLEAPIVQTGSAIGSVFAGIFPIGYKDRSLLLACGAASGIATAFNAPIAGVLFALEVLLVDVRISAFIPLLIAGATGSLCARILLNNDMLLQLTSIMEFNYFNTPYYILFGIFCGLFSVYYIRTYQVSEKWFTRMFPGSILRYLVGCVVLGLLIFLFPVFFGEGYLGIGGLSRSDFTWFNPVGYLNWISPAFLGFVVIAAGLLKAIAVMTTFQAGGNGGNFAPSLFVGACAGFGFAYSLNALGGTSLPLTNFILVGMAGLLTGIFHAPLTGIFLIAEITGGYDLIIPLMIVAAISGTISKYLMKQSLDEAKLSQLDNTVTFDKDSQVLAELTVSRFLETDFEPVNENARLRDLIEAIAHSKRNIFPVVSVTRELVGIIVLEDIREIMFDTTRYDSVGVRELMQRPLAIANYLDRMDSVMEKFDKTGVWNIPVVDKGRYMGFISKSRIFSRYRELLRNE